MSTLLTPNEQRVMDYLAHLLETDRKYQCLYQTVAKAADQIGTSTPELDALWRDRDGKPRCRALYYAAKAAAGDAYCQQHPDDRRAAQVLRDVRSLASQWAADAADQRRCAEYNKAREELTKQQIRAFEIANSELVDYEQWALAALNGETRVKLTWLEAQDGCPVEAAA